MMMLLSNCLLIQRQIILLECQVFYKRGNFMWFEDLPLSKKIEIIYNDVPIDIIELFEMGIWTVDEVLAHLSVNNAYIKTIKRKGKRSKFRIRKSL